MGVCACRTQQQSSKSSSEEIDLEIISWAKDSHGLYDYENEEGIINHLHGIKPGLSIYFLKKQLKGKLLRNLGVELVPSGLQQQVLSKSIFFYYQKNGKEIGEIIEDEGNLCFYSPAFQQIDQNQNDNGLGSENVWQVIRQMKKGNKVVLFQQQTHNCFKEKIKFLLTQGQIIRIGKLRFRVKELCTSSSEQPIYQTDANIEINEEYTNQDLCSEEKQHDLNDDEPKQSLNMSTSTSMCRICFSGSSSKNNPLISPCNCQGSLKFIHLKCLQRWLDAKVSKKESQSCQSLYWKFLECELCTKPLSC